MNPMDLNDKEAMLRRVRESAAQDPETLRRMNQMRGMLDGAQTIADLVAAYRAGCMPPNASVDQIRETEQAQYAICQTIVKMMLDKFREGGDAPQQWVDAILAEIDQYAAQRIAMMMARPDGQTGH
jgi:hypothetical protein